MTAATSAPLHALRFTGHDGRALVRLVPEQLVTAEDLALASVGVTREVGESDRTVGTTTVRAVGFPAWPIITDPANARHALNLVGDLEWARRIAASRAGDVKTRFDALAAELAKAAPHFVPTLLEELSRIFDLAGNQVYARQYFGKARETERSHNVPVDPGRHRAMFTEFAGAGIVGAKEMTAECTASLDRFDDPADALAHVLDIMGALTEAGNGPYAGMARDVRKVAKAAGVSAADADEKLLDAVLTGKGFARATGGMLKALKTSLPRYLTDHPDAAASFARHRPSNLGIEDFLGYLETSGQLDRLRGEEGYTDWLLRLVTEDPYSFSSPTPRFYAEIAGTGFGEHAPAQLDLWPLHPALVDALLAAGLDIVPAEGANIWRNSVNLQHWYSSPHWDLDHLAADPALGPTALGGRSSIIELNSHLDDLLAHSGTTVLLANRVAELAEIRSTLTGALPTLGTAVTRVLEPLADARITALVPDAVAELFAFDPAEELAAAVRAGLSVEYTWPGFEDAYTRLRAHAAAWADAHPAPPHYGESSDGVTILASYPHVAVIGGEHIEVLGPEGVLYSGTGPFGGGSVIAVHTVGDSGVVVYRESTTWTVYHWWFGAPAATASKHPGYWSSVTSVPIGTADAPARLLGSGLLTPGGAIPEDGNSTVLDLPGDVVHTVSRWDRKVSRYDRSTGDLLDTTSYDNDEQIITALGLDAPGGLFQDLGLVGTLKQVVWDSCTVLAVPEEAGEDGAAGDASVPTGAWQDRQVAVGLRTGDYGSTDTVVTPWGTMTDNDSLAPFTAVGATGHLLALPGGGRIARSAGVMVSPESGAPLPVAMTDAGESHVLHRLPGVLWVAVVPRDAGASARMRSYTAGQARAALDVLATDPDRGVPTVSDRSSYRDADEATAKAVPDADAVRRVLADQLGLTADTGDQTLLDALVHLVADTRALDATVTRLRGEALGTATTEETTGNLIGRGLTDDGARAFMNEGVRVWEPAERLRTAAAALGAWLQAGDNDFADAGAGAQQARGSVPDIACYLGREKLLIAHWVGTLADPAGEDVEGAVEFIRELVHAGILGGDWDMVTVAAPSDARVLVELGRTDTAWVDLGAPVHPVSRNGYVSIPSPGDPVQVLVRRADRDRLTVPVLPGSARPQDHLPAADLLAGLDEVVAAAPGRADTVVDADQVAVLAEATGFAGPTCRLLLGGVRSAGAADADLRKRYGCTVAQWELAQRQLDTVEQALRETLVIASLDGPTPAEGMAAQWREFTGGAGHLLLLTDEEWQTVNSVGSYWQNATGILTKLLLLGKQELGYPPAALSAVLAVVAGLSLADPRRPAVATLLRWMTQAAGEYAAHPDNAKGIGTVDIGCPVDDPAFKNHVTPDNQVVRVLTEGLLDELIADLDQVHPELPGTVSDPRNSVPDLVTEVASTVGVGEDAARYFLQLLTLALPTDTKVRAWNGWRKKDIDAAGAELVAADVVMQAKRAGAGRSFFLPGGWLEGRGGYDASKPMEVWKAPMYLLWADAKARPVMEGCPPHVPVASLFRTAWARYSSGDVPGYEELTTTRYRAGGRSRR